jgi:hypothetical protein
MNDQLWEMAKDLPVNPDSVERWDLAPARKINELLDPSGIRRQEVREMFKEWRRNNPQK